MIWLAAILVVLVLAGIWAFNLLVRRRNLVSEAWAGIDVQLQRRHELIPNLVAVARGYLAHEAGVLEQVTLSRGAPVDQVPAVAEQETGLSRAIGRLFALAEDYPDLKASENLAQLHDSLVEVEDQLQYARRYYNGAVRDYNTLVESFPVNFVAALFRFRPAVFFEIELASQRSTPHVAI